MDSLAESVQRLVEDRDRLRAALREILTACRGAPCAKTCNAIASRALGIAYLLDVEKPK